MDRIWGLDLDALLAMAAILLGLSIAAQVLQEIYKFLTASKARMYKLALRDFLGSWASDLYERKDGKEETPASMESLFLRGPFQFGWQAVWGERKKARLLPLDKQTLLDSLDDTAPEWEGAAIAALKQEVELQKGKPEESSPILRGLINEAWKEYQGEESAPWKIFDFLDRWEAVKPPPPSTTQLEDAKTEADPDAAREALKPKPTGKVDAARLLEGFYREFQSSRTEVETRFEQFNANFEHSYARRNLRQTFLLALVLAVVLNLPFSAIYRQASSLTPEEAASLADSLVELYEKRSDGGEVETPMVERKDEEPREEVPAPAATAEESPETPAEGRDLAPEEAAQEAAEGGDAKDADAAEDEKLSDLVEELRGPLEELLELDRRKEKEALAKLMEELEDPLAAFTALKPFHQEEQLDALLERLGEPLTRFVERTSDKQARETDREQYLEKLKKTLKEPIEGFIQQVKEGDEPKTELLVAKLRHEIGDLLDARAGRGKVLTRGVRQIATLWREDKSDLATFLVNCLITALLISFGAPFWHRLSKALVSVKKPTRTEVDNPETG